MSHRITYYASDLERARLAAQKGTKHQCLFELALASQRLNLAQRIVLVPAALATKLGAALTACALSGCIFVAFDTSVLSWAALGKRDLICALGVLWSWGASRIALSARPTCSPPQYVALMTWVLGAALYGFLTPAPWDDFSTWLCCSWSMGISTMAVAPLIRGSITHTKLGIVCLQTMGLARMAVGTLEDALTQRHREFEDEAAAYAEKQLLQKNLGTGSQPRSAPPRL